MAVKKNFKITMFVFVFCTLCCQFLWIVHFWLSLRYSPNVYFTHLTWFNLSGGSKIVKMSDSD